MQSHLVGGGLIVAATHGALGLSGAQELSLDRHTHARTADTQQPAEAVP
jgi:ABC-type transport system involved in cytochrome c biogenesis ATPase subunit